MHSVSFSHLEPTNLLSASDDATAVLWDIPSECPITTFQGHSDYIRTAQISPSSPNIVITGSYDRTVRLFDSRTGNCEMVLGGGEFFQAIEQVLISPASTLLYSAAGPILRAWDLVAGGRCLHAFSNHQKTITSITFASSGTRLLSGSLDRLVKVYDCSTYRVLHTMRYPAPILSLAISADDSTIATGMTDGTLSVRSRSKDSVKGLESVSDLQAQPMRIDPNTSSDAQTLQYRAQHRLRNQKKGQSRGNELRIESSRQKRLKPYDRFLKAFKYSAALDSVLGKVRSQSLLTQILRLYRVSLQQPPSR